MTDELREAAERLRAEAVDYRQNGGWPDHEYPELAADMEAVVSAYLAANSADSELPVTEEWLRAVGFELETDGTANWFRKADLELHGQPPHGWKPFVGSRMLRPVSTRGQLRGLCHWTCIALSE